MNYTFSIGRFLFQTNFAPIATVLLMIAFIKTNVSFSDKINRYFIIACICAFFLTISDNTRFITAHLNEPTLYRYISAGLGYALRPTIVFLLAIVAGRHEYKKSFLISIPLVFCISISLLSIFPFGYGIMFTFSDDNKFVRGPFGYLSHFTCFIYISLVLFYTIRNTKRNKRELIVVVIIIIAALVAAFMEHKFLFDFILSQVFISGIVFYYLFLVVQTFKTDSLTGLSNRRTFYLDLNHLLKSDIILLSMDLNNLKLYNDTLGHSAGDKALSTVATYMNKHFSKYAKLYRTGGDEFMGIFIYSDEDEVMLMVRKFQESLSSTEYRVACGIAKYTPEDDMEKIITLSDERMYSNKAKIKNEEAAKHLN